MILNKLYLIKDVSRISGLSVYTVKYYLKLGIVKESGRSPETNYRYFDEGTVKKLKKIRQLRKEKISLRKIKVMLNQKAA